ncbi:hypothetical protein Tco_0967319 [Tanacetum coccineum]
MSLMAALRYRDEHNKVGYLQKPKGSDDYHQILDFLGASHIRYALTHDPIIFDSLVKQFWSTATFRSPELGRPAILAIVDKTSYTITEESVRSQLQLVDDGGIDDLPIVEIYSGMDNLGYVTEGKLTFFKNKFSPQWRFLVHTLLHCLSTKSGSWDQFGSSIAVALICLSDGRRFNWSSYIFKGMVSNIGNAKKFLMYPRFLQAILAQEAEGAGADVQAVPPSISETIPETRHVSDHSQKHVSPPTRPQATPHVTPIFKHDQQTEPNIASSSRIHETEDDSLGGSFHVSPPRVTQASPTGHASGGPEDPLTISALSSAVSTLVKKKVKALEVKLKTKKRKVVLSDSDQEDGGVPDVELDALNALANVAVTVDSTKSPGGPSKNPAACSYDPTSDVHTTEVPSTEFPTDDPSDVAPTGPSTVSPGSANVPTSSSVPVAETIPASSGTTPPTPSSPVKDARKGKGVDVEEPTPTQDNTFKQLEEERLGWEAAQRLQAQELANFEKQRAESLMTDAILARQMSQDFEMTEDQRKRQQEVLASAANYSDAAWDIILARLQANLDLSSIIFGVEFTDDDFAARMVALVNSRRKELAEQWAQEQRDRPMTPSQLRQYMRTYVKNQKFDMIQRSVAFTRGLKRDGSPMTNASSKKLKTGDVEVNVEAPSDGVPQEEEAQVEVPSQEATIEDVEVPSNIASLAQHTTSSLKKVGTKKKRLGRKGVHTSQSTNLIEEGDPEAEHKVCIKYASDDDTPVNLYAVVDWELFPTGLGSINSIYRLDNSCKYFTSLREILHLVTRANLMTIYGRVMKFYQDKKAAGVGLVLWGDLKVLMDSPEVNDVSGLVLHMFVDKKYPLSVNLIERMIDHQLEICHGTVGNDLTTAVQLIAFLKKQISDSKRPKVINSPCYHNKELASPEQTATAEVVPKSVAGSRFPAASSTSAQCSVIILISLLKVFVCMLSQAKEGEEQGSSSSRIHETEDDSLGGSFHVSPPRFTQASPTGHASGGTIKVLFKDVVPKLVKKVKALEVKLKTKKRKVVLSDSDQEDGGEPVVDLDALIALANAAVTVDSTISPGGASRNPAACSYDPTSDVPTTAVPTDVPSGVDPTGFFNVSPVEQLSGTTTATPSSPVRDARKGKGVAVEEPTPTQDKTLSQLGRRKD